MQGVCKEGIESPWIEEIELGFTAAFMGNASGNLSRIPGRMIFTANITCISQSQ